MSELIISSRQKTGVTLISNLFIDEYLPTANGDYVKVYLLLLRMAFDGPAMPVSQIAEVLDITEKDVMRALRYWEKRKLLTLQLEGDLVTGVVFLDVKSEVSGTPGGISLSKPREQPELPKTLPEEDNTVNPVNLQELSTDPNFNTLLMIAGKYTCKNLSSHDLDILANLYQGVGMSAELLEYVIEYCVDNNHRSMRYIESVALSWHAKNIRTVAEAKNEALMGGKNTFAVLKAFGINGRNPAPGERKMIDKWYRSYGFPVEVVLEACDRTIRATHQPSFEYADKILTEWKKLGVKVKDDIARLDVKTAQTSAPAGKTEKSSSSSNRFHNSSERSYDADEVMKKISGIH